MKIIRKIIIDLMLITGITIIQGQYTSTTDGMVRFDGEIPKVIFNISKQGYTGTPEEIAIQYLNDNSEFLTANGVNIYEYIKTTSNPSGAHIYFRQLYYNIPVIGSETVVSINNNNNVTMVANGFKPGVNVDITPTISYFESIEIGKLSLGDKNLATVINPIYRLSIYSINVNNSFLVWELNILPQYGGDWYILIDAINGNVILKENIEMHENGIGTVWDPNPATFLETFELPDNNDENYPELDQVYINKELIGLDSPIEDQYYLHGDFVYSADVTSPFDPITFEELPEFYYNRSQNGFEEVNCYYHLDKMMRYIHELGFEPNWDNLLGLDSPKIVFDARGTTNRNAYYSPTGEFIKYGVPYNYKDAGEDESVIIHELGHALHDALIIGHISLTGDCRSISEGIGDYLGIDYRRQLSYWEPNLISHWFWHDLRTSIYSVDEKNFQDDWGTNPYTNLYVWASTLMDLQYLEATNPIVGETEFGREKTVTVQLAAVSTLTSENNKEDNALAIYQADIDIYEGIDLRHIIKVFNDRLMFDDQIVTLDEITSVESWDTYKWVQNELHILAGGSLTIEPSSYVVMDADIVVESGGELIISTNSTIHLFESSQITISEGSTLILEDNVTIVGNNSTFSESVEVEGEIIPGQTGNRITVNGNLSLGDNVIFTSTEGNTWDGLYVNGSDDVEVVVNNATFESCHLRLNGGDGTIENSNFISSSIFCQNTGDVTLQNSILTEGSGISTFNTNDVTIVSNEFFNSTGITVFNSFHFDISGNELNGSPYANTGIKVSDCNTNYPFCTIDNNTVEYFGGFGLLITNSYVEVYDNIIENNRTGFGISRNSIADFKNVSGGQNSIVRDNEQEEIIFLHDTNLEMYYGHNQIVDDNYIVGTDDECLIRCIGHDPPPHWYPGNYWGDDHGENRFWPPDGFIIEPIWNPPIPPTDEDIPTAQEIIKEGKESIVLGQIETAEGLFKTVIENYPASKESKEGMKLLLGTKKNPLSDQEFTTLRNYYESQANCSLDEPTTKLKNHLVRSCRLEEGFKDEVISDLDAILTNPDTPIDSLYALLDLYYIAVRFELEDESGLGRSASSKVNLSEINVAEIENQLFGITNTSTEMTESTIIPSSFELHHVYPNPFNPVTNITYEIPEDSFITIAVYNLAGRKVDELVSGLVQSGRYNITWNEDQFSSGVYFVTMTAPSFTSTQKVVLLK